MSALVLETASPAAEPRIHVLGEEVANQIAAGEVIERPSSVVKELLENAVDAGATRVAVEVEQGGCRLIRVGDNGEGMTPQEAVLALQRHATSKIVSADDLTCIRTLGFRGEALPSVASVAKVTITTRARGTVEGCRLQAAAAEILSLEPAGAPEGTTLEVADLFYNTPARLKFLKSHRTELAQACETLVRMALARPDVAFSLSHEGSEILRSPGDGDLENTVVALYGPDVAREMLKVEWQRGPIRVHGFVSRPDYTRPTRSAQSLFVNGRSVRSRTLSHGLAEAYRGTMPAGRFPAAVILVEMDSRLVDVNVHPTKAEVRFLRDWEAHRAVYEAVQGALAGTGCIQAPASLVDRSVLSPEQIARGDWSSQAGTGASAQQGSAGPPAQAANGSGSLEQPVLFQARARQSGSMRPLAQLWDSYILAESATGLVIVDQHLAHERILFHRLLEGETGAEVLRLQSPATLQVNQKEAILLNEALPYMASIGFELEPFGRGAFIVRSAPSYLAGRDACAHLREVLEAMMVEAGGSGTPPGRERFGATSACRAALKKGTPLALEEMAQLVDDLSRVDNPYTCPHGCPIWVELEYRDLLKRFKR